MRKKGLEVIVSDKKCHLCLGGQGAKKVIKMLKKTLGWNLEGWDGVKEGR